jgi:hypothetical protein
MKNSRRLLNRSVWLVLAAALLRVHPFATCGKAALPAEGTLQAEADLQACKEQLTRILEALEQYQVEHHRLPDWFLDLHPKFIADPKVFVCPAVQRLGDLSSWKAGVGRSVFFDPVLLTSYSYEFCAAKRPLAPGVEPTCQEYKKRQMDMIGDGVPVVRCLAHGPVLNLSIGGRFYSSGLYWEDEFRHLVPHEELADYTIFRDLLTAYVNKPRSYPPRDQRASAQSLDLAGSYNFGLNETFNPTGGEGDFANLPQGLVKLQRVNVTFDIRGRIQLRRKGSNIPFPIRVDGIKVDQVCRSIHFLCGTTRSASPGLEIGSFEVRYSDGQSNRIPILYGKPVQDWWFDPKKPQPEDARVWEGPSQLSLSQNKQRVRLYDLRWDNPLPDVRIATLDFVSALSDSAPFLIAITLE